MKMLVTGGAGFIGTNLIKRLLKDGHEVVSVDNYSTGKKENHQEGCKYYDVDLCEVEDYSFFMDKPDTIYHIAALARIQTSLREPQYHIKNNFVSTNKMFLSADKHLLAWWWELYFLTRPH